MQLKIYSPKFYPENTVPLPHSNTLSMEEKPDHKQLDAANDGSELGQEANDDNAGAESNTQDTVTSYSSNLSVEEMSNHG